MPRIPRVPCAGLKPGEMSLDVEASRYLVRVLRLREGAAIELFEPACGLIAGAVLTKVHPRAAQCHVSGVSKAPPLRLPKVTLVQALGKGTKMERVVSEATALGVSEIVSVVSERSVVAPAQGAAGRRLERWHSVALDAARQSGRVSLPVLRGPAPLEEALSLDGLRGCYLTPTAAEPLAQLVACCAVGPLTIAVGPEGGWSPGERERFEACGWAPAGLGPLVLRTELAAVAALSIALAHTA